MNSRDYWAKRAALDMVAYMRTAEQTAALIDKAGNAAARYITGQTKGIFSAFQSFGISEAEARRVLSAANDKTALQALRSAASKIKDETARKAFTEAINSAGAYRFRIDRLEEVGRQITDTCNSLYKTQLAQTSSCLSGVASSAYYHTIFNLQKQTGLAFSFAQFPKGQVDKLLKTHWTGASYSQRIWKNTNALADRLKDELLIGLMSGRSQEKTARVIREAFGANSFCARRLVRTESAYVANAAVGAGYDEAGIERYIFVATLDAKTSEVCAELDGKSFDRKDAKPGTNYPPMHPWCRSTTIADFGEDTLKGLERRAKDENGNTVKVSADMGYDEWYRQFVENGVDKSAGSGIMNTDNFNPILSQHNINDDIGSPDCPTCNPNFISGNSEYTNNCGNCSVAFEMRRRGFDVEANPTVSMYVSDWEKLFVGAQSKRIVHKPRADLADELRTKILKFNPSGSRGSIFVQWNNSVIGHFFSWEIVGDNVRFLDAQNGDINVSRYFQIVKPSSIIYQRWDNLEPSEMAIRACKNKDKR